MSKAHQCREPGCRTLTLRERCYRHRQAEPDPWRDVRPLIEKLEREAAKERETER
jgi:hypothetical protein